MDNKTGIQQLATAMALATGRQKKLCEDFVRELFATVAASLEAGDSVRIKGFGTFKAIPVEARRSVNIADGKPYDIPAHHKVVFVASKELAAMVNEPFEIFEAVEIADEIPTDDMMAPDQPEQPDPSDESDESDLSDQSDKSDESDQSDESDLSDDNTDDKPRSYKFTWGFFAGFLAAVLIVGAAVMIFGNIMFNKSIRTHHAEPVAVTVPSHPDTDTVAIEDEETDDGSDEVPTQASDSPVYDTVTTTRYLTTIAKDHYGNFNLWPVIYEENQAILGHPDRIRPGTKVVVPPLSKYGVDPSSADDIKAVKQKGAEIYGRF